MLALFLIIGTALAGPPCRQYYSEWKGGWSPDPRIKLHTGVLDIATCEAHCNAAPVSGCEFWVYNQERKECQLNKDLIRKQNSVFTDYRHTSGTRDEFCRIESCNVGEQRWEGRYPGGDLGKISNIKNVQLCRDECNSSPDCEFFVYSDERKECFLHKDLVKTGGKNQRYTSGFRDSLCNRTGRPHLFGFQSYTGAQVYQRNELCYNYNARWEGRYPSGTLELIKNVFTIADCAAECNSRPASGCEFFNYSWQKKDCQLNKQLIKKQDNRNAKEWQSGSRDSLCAVESCNEYGWMWNSRGTTLGTVNNILTPQECRDECNALPESGCEFFIYDWEKKTCNFYKDKINKSSWRAKTSGYRDSLCGIDSCIEYNSKWNYRYPSGELEVVKNILTPHECKTHCNGRPDCEHFQYSWQKKDCWLLKQFTHKSDNTSHKEWQSGFRDSLCPGMLNFAPTPEPTNAPTHAPTLAPTHAPTLAPTPATTPPPTPAPTPAPTDDCRNYDGDKKGCKAAGVINGEKCAWDKRKLLCKGYTCASFTSDGPIRCGRKAVKLADMTCYFNIETQVCGAETIAHIPCSSYDALQKRNKKYCKKMGGKYGTCGWDRATKMCYDKNDGKPDGCPTITNPRKCEAAKCSWILGKACVKRTAG